jgi:hypothetical protein
MSVETFGERKGYWKRNVDGVDEPDSPFYTLVKTEI